MSLALLAGRALPFFLSQNFAWTSMRSHFELTNVHPHNIASIRDTWILRKPPPCGSLGSPWFTHPCQSGLSTQRGPPYDAGSFGSFTKRGPTLAFRPFRLRISLLHEL